MEKINQSLHLIAIELDNLLKNGNYIEFGKLMRSSTTLFKYAFDKKNIILKKDLIGDYYVETFSVVGFDDIFSLHLIALEYQSN